LTSFKIPNINIFQNKSSFHDLFIYTGATGMSTKIYVGNLSYNVNNSSLETAFSEFGTVASAKVIIDRDTNRSKGFGFVEMSSADEAANAITSLNGKELDGRAMNVSEAKPMEPRNNNNYNNNRSRY
jgi:RNA recognition motif-containing protein